MSKLVPPGVYVREISSVQPMSAPASTVFYMQYHYDWFGGFKLGQLVIGRCTWLGPVFGFIIMFGGCAASGFENKILVQDMDGDTHYFSKHDLKRITPLEYICQSVKS